jgi:hypothetical protein
MFLDDEQIEAVRTRCGGKVGVIEWSGHQILFRRPSRDQVHSYRAEQDSAAEKPGAVDKLAQAMIVAFDGETDPTRARVAFTGSFLEEFPMFTSSAKCRAVMNLLSGLVESEDAADLGKGVSVRSAPPARTPKASESGSDGSRVAPVPARASLTGPPSVMTAASPQS